MTDRARFDSEADLVREFVEQLNGKHQSKVWTVYHETAGWDLLLVHKAGFQVGLEAKLTLNAKVIDQALNDQHRTWRLTGPDYRGVLVPSGGIQHHMGRICDAIGLGIVKVKPPHPSITFDLGLPDEDYGRSWPNWCPAERCALPDYIPDVEGGKSSPLKLTEWKIKAIRLMIVLERRGFVTRDDMAKIQISPSRWTDCYAGFLARGTGGYVRCAATPDLRAQHPTNYAQIEADADQWLQTMKINGFDPEKASLI